MFAVNLRIDPHSRIPTSEQLRARLATLIERGRLAPGGRLPTVRELAAELGIAPNTVAKAYRALESSGHVVGRGRSGTFVADVLPRRPDAAEALLDEAARAYIARARQLGFDSATARRIVDRALRGR